MPTFFGRLPLIRKQIHWLFLTSNRRMIIDCNQKLLADAEVGEDVVQGVVAGDFAAGDFAD